MKKHKFELALLALILAVAAFSLSSLTTKPKLWTDESMTIELARNFLNHEQLNFQSAPGEFFSAPFLLQSTGYPMTLPLALFFKLSGLGLVQARLFALAALLAALALCYWLAKKFYGSALALLAAMLVASFAPFYANGRTVTGEITGFIFLLLGVYFMFYRQKYFFAGLFFTLAVAAKPSIYLTALAAAGLVLLLERRDFWRRTGAFALGILPAAAAWLALSLPRFWSAQGWLAIYAYLKNPFGTSSAALPAGENLFNNLHNWPLTVTTVYFTLLFILISAALALNKKFFSARKNFYVFVITYSLLAAAYYLKSPGWLRYLLAAQILILMVLPPAASALLNWLAEKWPGSGRNFLAARQVKIFYAGMILLALIQLNHLLTRADIFYSAEAGEMINFLNSQDENKSVGFINALDAASLALTENRYQIVTYMAGLPVLGEDFLALPSVSLPDLVVADPADKILTSHLGVMEKFYRLIYNGKYSVYSLIGPYGLDKSN